jgi:multiple sugar transport system permease protein
MSDVREKTKLPLPLKLLAGLYLVAGTFYLINGLQLLYNAFLFHSGNILFVLFIILGLSFIATFRGLRRLEKWSRTFAVFTWMVVIIYVAYKFNTSRLMPSITVGILAIVSILYLNRYRTAQLFVNYMPELLRKSSSYIILSAIAVSMLVPFLWMLSTSFKQPGETAKWIPVKQYVMAQGQEYEAHIIKSETEIKYKNEQNKTEIVNSKRIKLAHAAGWIWPWRMTKWRHVVMVETDKGRYLPTPVTVGKRIATVRLLSEGPLESKVIEVGQSEIFSRLSPRFKNYPEAYKAIMIGRLYWNSIKIALIVTLGQVFTSSLAGYAFSRLNFPGRDKLFLAYLATMMVPAAVTMIPLFSLFNKVNLIDTHTAVILPGIFSAYGTFMLRQFFMSIPKDLEEAAKIDGCNLFSIYWRIILPLSKPALATLATFTFMGNWRSFIWPLIVLNSPEKMTLPIGLRYFMGLHQTEWSLLMAGSMMALLPIMIVFLFCQRFFVKGIQLGAVKG